jgi:hypothetical protein
MDDSPHKEILLSDITTHSLSDDDDASTTLPSSSSSGYIPNSASTTRMVQQLEWYIDSLRNGHRTVVAISIAVAVVAVAVMMVAGFFAGRASFDADVEIQRCHDGIASPWERSRLSGFSYNHERILLDAEQALDKIAEWVSVIKAHAQLAASVPTPERVQDGVLGNSDSLEYRYLKDCLTDDDFFRVVCQ